MHTTKVRRASPSLVESLSSSDTGLSSESHDKLHNIFKRAVRNEADADDGKKGNVKRSVEEVKGKEKKESGKTETVHDIINYIKEQGKKITEKIKPGEKKFGCPGCHDDDDDKGSGDDDDPDDDDKDKEHDDDRKKQTDKKKEEKDEKHHDKK